MARFEIVVHEQQKLVKATLEGDSIRVESGALHYWKGEIEMTSAAPGVGGFLRSAATGEHVFRPTYRGHGEVFVGPPYFGEFLILECREGHPGWVLDRGAYLCSDDGVEVTVHRNSAFTALLGGEGLFQTMVRGSGKVVLRAPGTVQTVQLTGDTLAVDGRFAVAREANLHYEVRRASKSLVGTMTSGEGLLQYISGTGRVLLAPVPDLQQSMIDKIGEASMPISSGQTARSPLAGLIAVGFGLLTLLVFFLVFAVGLIGAFLGG